MKHKILVVDDEPDATKLIAFNLKNAGYEILTADNGNDALQKAKVFLPDLIVLDLMMPEIDGLEVCKRVRRDPLTAGIPIIMVSGKAGEIDRILAFELGANRYLTKPITPRELLLHTKSLLERPARVAITEEHYEIGELKIDIPRHEVTVGNKRVNLTITEFKLLTTLIDRCGYVQSRERLLLEVWEYESGADSRTVDTHMRRLRGKLGKAARFLRTVYGTGYRFDDAAN